MKTVAEIVKEIEDKSSWVLSSDLIEEIIMPSVIEYGQQQYNKALLEAADKATARIVQETINGGKKAVVNRESILNLIKK